MSGKLVEYDWQAASAPGKKVTVPPGLYPLARQQHLSADLGTGMDLLGGVDALLM